MLPRGASRRRTGDFLVKRRRSWDLSDEDLLRLTRPIPELLEAARRRRGFRAGRRSAGRRSRPVYTPPDSRRARTPRLPRSLRRPRRRPRRSHFLHRRPRRRRAPALDEEGPGHCREDRVARGHHSCPVTFDFGQDSSAVRSDVGSGGRRVVRGAGRICPQGIGADSIRERNRP